MSHGDALEGRIGPRMRGRNDERRRPSSGVQVSRRSSVDRWRALADKALGRRRLRGAWSRAPTTASASNRSARARRRCRARAIAQPTRCAMDRRCSASTIPIRSAPTGRRWRTSSRAPPAWRWSSRARRTPSATACRPTPEALATVLRRRAAQPHPSPDRRPSRRAAPCVDWLVAYLVKRRVDPAKLSLSFGIDPAAVFAGTGRLQHVDRGAAGLDAAIAGAFLRARPAGRAARGRRPRLPQCRRHRGAGTRHRARLRRLASADVRGSAPGAGLCRAAYRLRAQRRPGPVPVDGQDAGAAHGFGRASQEACSIPPASATHPCRDLLPHDDGAGPRDQHPAHHDRRLRGGGRRRRFDLHPAAHDRARPARRLRAAHRPQHAADHGRRKPYRFRRRSGRRLRQRRSADRCAVRGGVGRIPARSKRKAASWTASRPARSRRASSQRAREARRRHYRDGKRAHRRHDARFRCSRASARSRRLHARAAAAGRATRARVFCERCRRCASTETDRRPRQ